MLLKRLYHMFKWRPQKTKQKERRDEFVSQIKEHAKATRTVLSNGTIITMPEGKGPGVITVERPKDHNK